MRPIVAAQRLKRAIDTVCSNPTASPQGLSRSPRRVWQMELKYFENVVSSPGGRLRRGVFLDAELTILRIPSRPDGAELRRLMPAKGFRLILTRRRWRDLSDDVVKGHRASVPLLESRSHD
jgi:hypothetical protein